MNWTQFYKNEFRSRYFICDCEHEGDIHYAENEVKNAGGTVDGTDWDGNDCGEAYVYFHCNTETELKRVCKKLGTEEDL